MINKRDFLKSCGLGLVAPFSLFNSKKKINENSKHITEVIGKIITIKIDSAFDLEQIFEFGQSSIYERYIKFPQETRITFIGEYGEMEYSAFNVNVQRILSIANDPQSFLDNITEVLYPINSHGQTLIYNDKYHFHLCNIKTTKSRDFRCSYNES